LLSYNVSLLSVSTARISSPAYSITCKKGRMKLLKKLHNKSLSHQSPGLRIRIHYMDPGSWSSESHFPRENYNLLNFCITLNWYYFALLTRKCSSEKKKHAKKMRKNYQFEVNSHTFRILNTDQDPATERIQILSDPDTQLDFNISEGRRLVKIKYNLS
jgi:hypothetical protein